MLQQPKSATAVLPVIVFAQFFCTSLWFAGNAVLADMILEFRLAEDIIGFITSSVQLGFIIGTLVFAIFSLADRYAPSKVFFWCAILGAICNLLVLFYAGFLTIVLSRFLTGVCLAGIYPVGMKIAADYHQKGLGKALGYLVGALVLGTAFPHLLKSLSGRYSWKVVLIMTSALSAIGGTAMWLLVPNGPYRKSVNQPDFTSFFRIFRKKDFRHAAFGYFGHMWELYTFWAFVPIILAYYGERHHFAMDISLFSFLIIGVGSLSCIAGGYLSNRVGSPKVAFVSLLFSGICCVLSVPMFGWSPTPMLLLLFIWGFVVVSDSPQFSSMVATSAPSEVKGTALTIVNSIGFAMTIVSIQFLTWIEGMIPFPYIFLILAIGPAIGIWSIRRTIL